jgi:hypothetical protein
MVATKFNFYPRIFIGTPLAPACGQWVDLPIDSSALEAIRKKIAGDCDSIISDYEDLPGIVETTPLEEVNEYAEWLVNETPEPDVIDALLDAGIEIGDIPKKYEANDFFAVDGSDERELGENYVELLGGLDCAVSREELESYFDYKQYGRDLAMSGFAQYGNHWVSVN